MTTEERTILIAETVSTAFEALGFAAVEVGWKADKVERLLATEDEAARFSAEITRFGGALQALGLELASVNAKLDTGDRLGFEPPRYGDGPPTLTVAVMDTQGFRPDYDPTVDTLYGRLCLATWLTERLVAGILSSQCTTATVTAPLKTKDGLAGPQAESKAVAAAMQHWFDRCDAEPEGTPVTLHFQNWWTLEYTRMGSANQTPIPVRIQTYLGEPGTPVASRLGDLAARGGALDAIRQAVDKGDWLEFKLNAWGTKLQAFDVDWLEALVPVAEELSSTLEAVPRGGAMPRHYVVGLGHDFVVETATKGVNNKVSAYLPWFHPARLPTTESIDAFTADARADIARVERVRAWMAETDRVSMFWANALHAPWCMHDDRLSELLEALSPHIAAIDRDEYQSFGTVFFFLEAPTARIWLSDNYIKIPTPELGPGEMAPFLDAWFAANPLPPLEED